jgi:hypothetical protein
MAKTAVHLPTARLRTHGAVWGELALLENEAQKTVTLLFRRTADSGKHEELMTFTMMDNRLVYSSHPSMAASVLGGKVPSVNNLDQEEPE